MLLSENISLRLQHKIFQFLFTADVDECETLDEPCTGNRVCVNRIGDYICPFGKAKICTDNGYTIMITI